MYLREKTLSTGDHNYRSDDHADKRGRSSWGPHMYTLNALPSSVGQFSSSSFLYLSAMGLHRGKMVRMGSRNYITRLTFFFKYIYIIKESVHLIADMKVMGSNITNKTRKISQNLQKSM